MFKEKTMSKAWDQVSVALLVKLRTWISVKISSHLCSSLVQTELDIIFTEVLATFLSSVWSAFRALDTCPGYKDVCIRTSDTWSPAQGNYIFLNIAHNSHIALWTPATELAGAGAGGEVGLGPDQSEPSIQDMRSLSANQRPGSWCVPDKQ